MSRKRAAPNSPISDDALDQARLEAAELMGLDPNALSAGDRLKCDLISALRAAVDDELGKITSANAADLGKLIVAVETLTRFLADARPKEDERGAIYKRDPYKVLDDIAERWRQADAADRREKGLSPRIHDEEAQQRRIDDLEAELVRLRGAQPHALPAPEAERGAITPPTGDIVPPGEQSDRAANAHYSVGQGTPPKPPVTIEGKVAGSWTGPQDGPPPWLQKTKPVEKRVDGGPPQAVSGDEAKRRMQTVNADRATPHKIMTSGGSEKFPQPDNGGFFFSGERGRSW